MKAELLKLMNLGQLDAAEHLCRSALAATPDDFELHLGLSAVHWTANRLDAALGAARIALTLAPADTQVINHVSGALRALGTLPAAANWAQRSLRLKLDQPAILSHLTFVLNEIGHPAAEAAARAYDAVVSRPPLPPLPPAGGRLRVGIVSNDFRTHVCMTFLRPLLDHIDRRKFRLFAYATLSKPDVMTEAIRPRFDTWRDITGLSDEQAARQVHEDAIDVLIDLGGHTADSRLGLFAYHPARAQASWLGYNGTTGMRAMDWRIVDPWIAPAESGEWFAEQLWRLPRISHCWRPPSDSPGVARSPVLSGRPFTFGSFNNFAKMSPETLAAWARILTAVPQSRLLLKSWAADEEAVRRRVLGRLEAAGLEADRIVFRPRTSTLNEHLAVYGDVDVALDAFPYNGTTTTCDALWMGVPVVTLRGTRMLGRISYSLLASLKLEDRLAAHSVDEMVSICTDLAANPAELARLRAEIRPRFEKSSLRDEAGFARAMERAFTAMAKQAGSRPRG